MPIASLLNIDATITSVGSTTVDGEGNPVETTVTAAVKCHLQQISAEEVNIGDRSAPAIMAESAWRIFLPAGTALDPNDRITIDAADYEVRGAPWLVRNARSGVVDHIEANLIQVVRA